MSPRERQTAVTWLRALADALEERAEEELPTPHVHVSFSLMFHPAPVRALDAITDALPLRWQGSRFPAFPDGWSHKATAGPVSFLATSKASAMCVPDGTQTVTAYVPTPEVAAIEERARERADAADADHAVREFSGAGAL